MSGNWSTSVCSFLPCTDVLKRLLPFIESCSNSIPPYSPRKPHLTMWKSVFKWVSELLKGKYSGPGLFFFFLMFLNIKFSHLAINLKNEMVNSTHNQLSATQNIKNLSPIVFFFFLFPSKQCMPIKTQELFYQNKPMTHLF